MPPRKQPLKEVAVVNVTNPQQFLLKFAERNFERQEIDEQSFIKFNKFVAILGKQLSQKTSISDVEGFVAMIKTTFQNFQDLNRSRPTFSLYLQLLQICLSIFEKAVSLDLSREICFELLDILKPVYDSIKPEDSFLKMEQKFKKINMPQSFSEQQTMTKINEFQGLPALYSETKYQKLVSLTILVSSQDNGMHSIMKSYMNIEGENFLDSILVVLMKCINQHDHERFKKGLKIYLSIGDSTADQTKNLSVLITKVLSSKNKLQFLYLIFTNTDLQKIFEPNHLFFVCMSTLDTILSDRQITPQTLELFAIINKFLTIFRQIDKVSEEEKILNLYNKVLSVILLGKYVKETVEPKLKKLRSSELIRERLQKYEKEEPQARKFNFIQQLANLQELAELEDQAYIKKQDDHPAKQEQKLVPLKQEQLSKMSAIFRRMFASFATNKQIMSLAQKVYESQSRTQQFLKLCMVSHISPDALQLILASYIPLISLTKQYDIFTNIGKDDPSLMKIIKLRMLESKLETEHIKNEEVFKKYYLPLHDRLVTANGLNFEFLALTILHEYMDDFKMLITELTRRCLDKISSNAENKAIYFRCCLALIASLLDLHHNIVIKLSYNRISMHVNKLNNKFQVQDFLVLTEVKENKLFLAGPRVQVSHETDMELSLLRNFLTSLFSKVERLSDLFNLPSSEENSYYYMILVELCTLCMQRDINSKFVIESKEIQSIIQIRRNNKYSLGVTITGETISVLRTITQQHQTYKSITPNELTVVLHLLMKLQSLMSEPNPPAKPACDDISMEDVNNNEISSEKLSEVSELLTILLTKIAVEPHFESLKILCRPSSEMAENTNPFDQLGSPLSSSGAVNNQMFAKKNKLKECIKHFHMIKFYSEATSNEHMLSLMVTKNSLRVLQLIWDKVNKEESNPELNKQKQNIQTFRIFYGHQAQNENERKCLQVYMKLRLLAMTGETQNKLSFDEIKQMTKYLEDNHDEVARLLVSEQNDQKILGVQSIFQAKTNFIRYLLDQIVKAENQSLADRQISLLTLSLLKTLIDNHSTVLQISKRHTFEKLENSEVITTLVVSRTKKSLESLRALQKQKKLVKQEGPNETVKQRLCQKEQQKILEESKKIYVIFSKMLSSAGSLKNEKEQSILQMVDSMIKSDDTTDIFVSIYILRQVLNISPILKCTLGKEASLVLSQKIFTYLMLLKQNYSGVFINGAQQVTIFSIINYFVENFYAQSFSQAFSSQLNDGIVVTQINKKIGEKQKQKMDEEPKGEKQKKPTKKCLINQKKGSFKCIKCDPNRQICLNCTMVCHKNHPVVFLHPNLRSSKSCQCSQQFCKINTDFEKKKVVNERQRKSKQPYRRDDYPRSYIEEFQRVPEELRHLSDEDLDQESFNFMYAGHGSNVIRAQESGMRNLSSASRQPAIYGRPSEFGASRYGSLPLAAMNPAGNVMVPPLNQGISGAQFSAHFTANRYGNPPGSAPLTGLIGGINRYDNPPGSAALMGLMGGMNASEQPSNVPNLGQPVPAGHYFFSSRNEDEVNPLRTQNTNMYEFAGRSENELTNFLSLREERQREREIRERQILRERERLRHKEREREQMRAFINESKYGLGSGDYPEKIIQKLESANDANDPTEQEDPSKDKFEDEDYETTMKRVEQNKSEMRLQQIRNNKNVQDLTMEHSYLLSEFINMTIELCESKKDPSQSKEPEVTWNIKLANPFVMNPSIMHTSSKIYASKTFITKLAKTDGSFHPSPCVSRAPLAVSEKYIFVISGPKINVHEKQQIFQYLIEKNGTTMNYEMVKEQHLQFEPHSVVVGHKNLVCVAGLHQVNLFECELGGQLVNRSNLRTSINNDNINKIKMNKFGVFLGLSREIRLLNHSLQNKMFFKLEFLIKEWCVLVNSEDSFTLYVTCSQGYIFYADGNANSTGEIVLIKKLIDSRSNRPVGSFFLAKKIEGCGVLLLSAFKDKSIGHSLSRLSGESLTADLNYMKLNNQGLEPIFEKYYIMGLSDMALVWDGKEDKASKQLIIVTLYKEDKNDIMAVHRGLLAVIRVKFDPVSGFSKPETQLICGEEERCEYFELVWMEDRKNWVILSLGEDGSLRVTVPVKMNKASLQKQRSALKEKKVTHDKNDHQSSQKQEESKNNRSEEQQVYEKLSASIKEHISLKSLKQSISSSSFSPNDYMQYIDSAELLRYREDYLISVSSTDNQIKKYEIKQVNKRKIITGFSLGECSDITLQTRKLEAVFEVAFTQQQALYYYAFGNIKFERKKNDIENYVLDIKKGNPMRNKNESQAAQQRLFSNPNNNKVLPGEVSVLGEVFEVSFKPKIKQLMQKLQKFMSNNNPFEQSELQKLESALKCCNLLLSNSLESNNCTVGHDEAIGFVEILKAGLLSNKSKQQLANKLYYWIKRVIYKALKLQECEGSNTKLHVFNDEYYPLKFATETKIKSLYESLNKKEISDQDYLLLVNELYGMAAGSREQQVDAVNQSPDFGMLVYYIATYPSMLLKIHAKIKILENAKLLYRAIPLYVFGYLTLKYLEYHLEWMLPALFEIVGKLVTPSYEPGSNPNELKPSILSRYLLYKYLKQAQSFKLQPWLKNIVAVDAQQCLKDAPPLINKQSSGLGRPNFGGLVDYGLIEYPNGQFEMEDEEAMLRRVLEESEREAARMNENLGLDEFSMPKQAENEMEPQVTAMTSFTECPKFMKEIVEQTLKQIDYTTPPNTEASSQKVAFFYSLYKLCRNNYLNRVDSCKDSYEFLCWSICEIVEKLCASYQQTNSSSTASPQYTNTLCILMMWLNLFGMIFKDIKENCSADQKLSSYYEKTKDSIIGALSKFKIENVKKLQHVPNLFARRMKGLKILTKAHIIYGFISVLQRPCQANFVLLTLGCYWLFPQDEKYYQKKKYVETIRENEKTGNINKIYETAVSNLEIWKEVGDTEWLSAWVEAQRENWPRAIELLALYYE